MEMSKIEHPYIVTEWQYDLTSQHSGWDSLGYTAKVLSSNAKASALGFKPQHPHEHGRQRWRITGQTGQMSSGDRGWEATCHQPLGSMHLPWHTCSQLKRPGRKNEISKETRRNRAGSPPDLEKNINLHISRTPMTPTQSHDQAWILTNVEGKYLKLSEDSISVAGWCNSDGCARLQR